MNKEVDKTIKFKQLQGWVENITISVKKAPFPDFSTGTYEAFAARSRDTFDVDYDTDDSDYLYKVTDAEIRAVSPNIERGDFNIPFASGNIDIATDFYCLVIADLGENARIEILYKLENTLKNQN